MFFVKFDFGGRVVKLELKDPTLLNWFTISHYITSKFKLPNEDCFSLYYTDSQGAYTQAISTQDLQTAYNSFKKEGRLRFCVKLKSEEAESRSQPVVKPKNSKAKLTIAKLDLTNYKTTDNDLKEIVDVLFGTPQTKIFLQKLLRGKLNATTKNIEISNHKTLGRLLEERLNQFITKDMNLATECLNKYQAFYNQITANSPAHQSWMASEMEDVLSDEESSEEVEEKVIDNKSEGTLKLDTSFGDPHLDFDLEDLITKSCLEPASQGLKPEEKKFNLLPKSFFSQLVTQCVQLEKSGDQRDDSLIKSYEPQAFIGAQMEQKRERDPSLRTLVFTVKRSNLHDMDDDLPAPFNPQALEKRSQIRSNQNQLV